MTGCEHMKPKAKALGGTSLCCLLECQEPGPTGPTFNLSVPSFSAVSLPHVVLPLPQTQLQFIQQPKGGRSPSTLQDTYLKNLALLI